MKLVVARNPLELRRLTPEIRSSSSRLLTTSDSALVAGQELGLPVEPIQAFASLEEWPGIVMDAAYDVSRNWWRARDLEDIAARIALHRGVNLWDVLELPVYHVVSEAVYALLLAERVLDDVAPEEVVICRRDPPDGGFWIGFSLDLRAEAVALVAAGRGIAVRELKAPRADASVVLRGARRFAGATRQKLRRTYEETYETSTADVLVHAVGRHFGPLLPVVRQLTKSVSTAVAQEDLDALGKTSARTLGVPLVGVESYPSPFRLGPVGERLTGLEFHGHPLGPLIGFQLDWLLQHGLPEIDQRLDAAERLLDAVRPRVLVVATDTDFKSLSLILPARRRGIPIVTQLHGAVPKRPRKTQWAHSSSDVLATWGTLNKLHLSVVLEWPDERLPLVGYPHFDELPERARHLDRAGIRTKLGVTAGERIVLFLVSMTGGALSPFYGSGVDIYGELFEAAKTAGVDTVIVRSHQASDPAVALSLGIRSGIRTLVDPPIDLVESVVAADVVVSQPTTALLEAMLIGRPTIFFTAQTAPDALWWLEQAEMLSAADGLELANLLRELLVRPESRQRTLALQKEFLAAAADPLDGGSAHRTADLVHSTLSRATMAATAPGR